MGFVDGRDLAVRQLVEDLAGGRGGAPDRDQLALEDEEALERPVRRRLEDLVLEVVDLVGQAVQHRKVAVDDVIGEDVEEEVRSAGQHRLDAGSQRPDPRAGRTPARGR